ncbi:MAG: hypothetical protein ACOY0T_33060 [Myxococcota bacterium]
MAYRVFAQVERPDPAQLVKNATRYFEGSLEILEQPAPHRLRVRIRSERRGYAGDFSIESRTTSSDDLEAATRAEERSRAGGMAALASRCAHVWSIEPDEETPALLNLCAITASVALGPVLPADESALFGVRGAMERLDRLVGRSLAR